MAPSQTANAVLVLAASVGALGFVIYACLNTGERRALAWSERSGLPLPDSATGHAVVARLRRGRLTESVALLVGVLAASLLLFTPLADSSLLFSLSFVPAVAAVYAPVTAVVCLREHLFVPASLSPRLARVRERQGADYGHRAGRRVTGALAGLAVLAILATAGVVASGATNIRRSVLVLAIVLCLAGLCATAALPALERAVLSRAQPASTAVQLAWDDLLRVSALNGARSVAAYLCVAGVVCTISAVTGGSGLESGLTAQVIVWLQLGVQFFFFPTDGRGLPENLRPNPTPLTQSLGAPS